MRYTKAHMTLMSGKSYERIITPILALEHDGYAVVSKTMDASSNLVRATNSQRKENDVN